VRLLNQGRKFATTVLAARIVTVHVLPLTVSHPVQPLKMDRPSAVAVSVTAVPAVYVAAQAPPQVMPPGLDVIVPVPRPSGPLVLLTVSLAVTMKLAVLVAVPADVVTLNGPDVVPAGTVD
jgi:hypothetical protein